MYGVTSYFFSKTLGELPIYFISVNILIGIVYPSANLNDTFTYKYYVAGIIFNHKKIFKLNYY